MENIFLNISKNYVHLDADSKIKEGEKYSYAVLPPGVEVDGADLSGGLIYLNKTFVFENKFNSNLMTVRYDKDFEIHVKTKDDKEHTVKAEDLCTAVTKVNKEYLAQKTVKEKQKEEEIEL